MDKKEIVIFPESLHKLKTKSQLKNIWEQANKSSILKPKAIGNK